MKKQWMAGLCAAVLLSGCVGCTPSGESSVPVQQGRYVEEQLTLTPKPASLAELTAWDGRIAFMDGLSQQHYQLAADGQSFVASAMDALQNLVGDPLLDRLAMAPDGAVFFSYFSKTQKETVGYAYVDANGKYQPVQLDVDYLTALEFAPDGTLFGCRADGRVFAIDPVQQTATELFAAGSDFMAFDVVNGCIFAVDQTDFYCYDYQAHAMLEPSQAMKTFFAAQALQGNYKQFAYDFCSGDDNTFYIVSAKGLYRAVMGGNQVEQLLDATACHLGNPSYHLSSIVYEPSGALLVAYAEGAVMRYHYDATASNAVTAALQVYALEENPTLQQVVNEFSSRYPNVRVELQIGRKGGVSYEDALKNLTTAILSGNAPDILLLDGLDAENFADKHMLVDLSPTESTWNPDNNLLDAVAKWNQTDGLYSVACKLLLPTVVGWKDDLANIQTLTDLKTFVQQARAADPNAPIARLYSEPVVLDTALQLMGNQLLTEDGVQADALRSMLQDCKEMYDCEKDAYSDMVVSYYNSGVTAQQADRWEYGVASCGGQILCEGFQLALGTIGGFTNALNLLTSLQTPVSAPVSNPSDLSYRFGLSADDHCFLPCCNLAICAAGRNPEQALAFLQLALSEDLQTIELQDGFPVNRAALDTFYAKRETEDGMGFGIMAENDQSALIQAEWMDAAEVEAFRQTLDALTTPIVFDTLTTETIRSIGTKCLDGTLTPEQATEDILAQLNLRMKE